MFFGAVLVKDLHVIYSKSCFTRAFDADWSVEEINERFAIRVAVLFEVNNQPVKGSYTFGDRFPNPYIAKQYLEKYKKTHRTLFYSPKKPGFCALERVFPWKRLFYCVILLGISVYFWILQRRLVARGFL